jgi:hypothetical protein
VLDRFFDDECEFGPKLRVSKNDLYQTWERWCDQEGADPGTKTGFGGLVKERGITRGFVDGRDTDGSRVWKGIGLHTPQSGDRVKTQKSWKQGGITNSFDTISEFEEKVVEQPLMEESLAKEANRVEPVSDTFTVDGVEAHYKDMSEESA